MPPRIDDGSSRPRSGRDRHRDRPGARRGESPRHRQGGPGGLRHRRRPDPGARRRALAQAGDARRGRAASCSRSRRAPTSSIPAVAGVHNGTVRLAPPRRRPLTMRALSLPGSTPISTRVGDAAFASVGAYQIEGPGIQLFERIEGDYFTILGLPLMPLLEWPAAGRRDRGMSDRSAPASSAGRSSIRARR